MIKAGQHVFDCLAGEDVGSMHWSMHCFAPVCCSFLPCRLNAFSFSSFSFHSFCNFFTPAFQASSRKKRASPVLHSPFNAGVVSRSSPRDEVYLGWGSVRWVGHTTHKWELLPFDLKKSDALDALYEAW